MSGCSSHYLDKKTPKDFVPGRHNPEASSRPRSSNASTKTLNSMPGFQYERWKAPIYIPKLNNGANNDTVAAVQVTWYPPPSRRGTRPSSPIRYYSSK